MNDPENPARMRWATIWKRTRSSVWFHAIVALSLVALLTGFVIKPYSIPSSSMEATLEVGDRVLASRLPMISGQPERGDIMIFEGSEKWVSSPHHSGIRWVAGAIGDVLGFGMTNKNTLVKRIVGIPGDTVECCESGGSIKVNGKVISEPYTQNDYPFEAEVLDCNSTPYSRRCFGPITVGEDEYLMLGDNRSNSNDSVFACRGGPSDNEAFNRSCAKFATRDQFRGEAVLRVWPISRFGNLR